MTTQLNDLLIDQELKIIDAMELIGKTSARILIIVDKNKRLIGTLTDGDIRRAIIDNVDMESPVSKVMRKDPVSANYNISKNELISLMSDKNLLAIPIVDENGKVRDLETLLDLTKVDELPNNVLIMAGGFGKRLMPLTSNKPKPLLSIEDGPLLEKLIENLSESGFKHITIAIHYKSEMIKDYFQDGSKWGIEIDYIEEIEPLGTGGAIKLLGESKIGNFPFLVLNADLVTRVNFKSLIESHNESSSLATICASQYEQTIPYGVLRIDESSLIAIDEKPKEKFFINAGIYVISPRLINDIRSFDDKFDMTDLIQYLLESKKSVSVFPIHEYWIDVGEINHFNQAKKDLKEQS